jgi:membrane protease YdiL (CAAX protease family)
MGIAPWIHILLAYVIYIVVALLTSAVVGRLAGDLRDFKVRNSPPVLLAGAAANLLAMAAILLLLVTLDGRPVAAIGLSLRAVDLFVCLLGLVATFGLATAFLAILRRVGRVTSVVRVQPAPWTVQPGTMALGLVVLQEEVLNRAYVTLNLVPLGPWAIVIVSTLIFVGIHFLTNRGSVAQVVSWTVSGLVLILAYLLSSSIWVPVVLHYATDASNLLVFNITGQQALFRTEPAVTEEQRAAFRVVYGVVMAAILLGVYGLSFRF